MIAVLSQIMSNLLLEAVIVGVQIVLVTASVARTA